MADNKVFLKLYKETIRNGICRKLGAEGWQTLTVIASFMDEKGEAFPTQQQLSELLGVSREAVNKRIKKLLNFRLEDGSPIIVCEKRDNNKGYIKNCIYHVLPESGFSIFYKVDQTSHDHVNSISHDHVKSTSHDRVKPTSHKEEPNKEEPNKEEGVVITNARDFITYFCRQYRETYGVNYNPNWGRDGSMIKNKLLGVFDSKQLVKIVDTIFKEYDRRWKKPKYPRPTIGQIVSWLANEALAVAEELEEEDQETQRRIEEGENSPYLTDEYFEKVQKYLLNDLD